MPALTDIIWGALHEAHRAQPHQFREAPDGSGDFRALPSPVPAAAMRVLQADFAQAISTTAPRNGEGNLAAEVIARSRLAAAGVRVLPIPAEGAVAATAVVGGDGRNVPVRRQARAEHSVILAAGFQHAPEDDEFVLLDRLADVTPLFESGLKVWGFRTRMTREQVKARPIEVLAAEMAESMMQGIGRVIDRAIMEALETAGAAIVPTASGMAAVIAAGAAGHDFSQLRAVIGCGGAAPAGLAGDQGGLYWQGAPAILTAEGSASFLINPAMHAFAVGEEINVLVRKVGATGALEASAFIAACGITPPRAGLAWRVS